MLDFNPSEFLVVAVVALVVIGPKDLPKAMRVLGYWVGKARGVARQFRSGFDAMVREAELDEMEKRWKEENERIMREHPASPATVDHADDAPAPVMTMQPAIDHDADQSGPAGQAPDEASPMLDLPAPEKKAS